MDISSPTLMDNKDLRNANPAIKAHFDASEKEMKEFSGAQGVIKDQNKIDNIVCPICHSDNSQQLLVKWGGRYDECKTCSHVFLKNPFKQEILNALYKNSIVDQLNRVVQKHSFNERYWAAVYRKYMDFMVSQTRKPGKLIDVGCGTGRFLRFCKENYDLELFALDVYDDLIASVSDVVPEENIFLVDSFENADIKKKFDLVTLWGVLEHCRSPHKILSKCHDYLEDDGLVFMLIPNIHSRARKLLGIYTPTLNPREHINFFTPQSMEKVAVASGFSVFGFFQELPVIDLMWPYLDEESPVIDEIISNKECYYHLYILKKVSK
ncbi:class I SAM-dependent methyltransferase [Polaromonas sp.]|uniref:class I SAM-dependent methyltransferase n=1 Tax=Polaromonas sp. TaxID=1869339 RepID=UPI0037C61E94